MSRSPASQSPFRRSTVGRPLDPSTTDPVRRLQPHIENARQRVTTIASAARSARLSVNGIQCPAPSVSSPAGSVTMSGS